MTQCMEAIIKVSQAQWILFVLTEVSEILSGLAVSKGVQAGRFADQSHLACRGPLPCLK